MYTWICKQCGESYDSEPIGESCEQCGSTLIKVIYNSEEYLRNKYKYFNGTEIPPLDFERLEDYEPS